MTFRVALLIEVVVMAFDTVRTNKMRSFLTVLGVVIGITSIVGMTAMIRGFDESLRNSIRSLGPDTIFVAKFSGVSVASGKEIMELLRRPNLTLEDAHAIQKLPAAVRQRAGRGDEVRRPAESQRCAHPLAFVLPADGGFGCGGTDAGGWRCSTRGICAVDVGDAAR